MNSEEVVINKKKSIYDVIASFSVDEYLTVTMHNQNEEDADHEHENEDGITQYSHLYPHMPCLDFNGWFAPDSKHIHDFAHFFGSDCYQANIYYCAGDGSNSSEYCDGSKNCSHFIYHSSSYHAH